MFARSCTLLSSTTGRRLLRAQVFRPRGCKSADTAVRSTTSGVISATFRRCATARIACLLAASARLCSRAHQRAAPRSPAASVTTARPQHRSCNLAPFAMHGLALAPAAYSSPRAASVAPRAQGPAPCNAPLTPTRPGQRPPRPLTATPAPQLAQSRSTRLACGALSLCARRRVAGSRSTAEHGGCDAGSSRRSRRRLLGGMSFAVKPACTLSRVLTWPCPRAQYTATRAQTTACHLALHQSVAALYAPHPVQTVRRQL